MNAIMKAWGQIHRSTAELLPWMLQTLRDLVEIETPSRDPDSHGPILEALHIQFSEIGMSTSRLRGKGNSGGMIYAESKSNSHSMPTQLLIGHADTVWPKGTVSERPFEINNEIARGPGVFDMKGGIVQMITALRVLSELNLKPEVRPSVLINTDEEIGSRESSMEIGRLAEVADRVFVLEPALGLDGKLKTTRKGTGRFDILIRGKSAHAGLAPGEGASAIVELSHVIQTLNALNDPERGITVNVGQIGGGFSANVVAPTSTAAVDVRVPTQNLAEELEQQIRGLKPVTDGTSIVVDGRFARPPLELTTANRHLRDMALDVAQTIGIEISEGMAGGGSDGSYTSLHTATLDGLGAVGDGAHAEHEFLYVDKMVERSAYLAALLMAPSVIPEPESVVLEENPVE